MFTYCWQCQDFYWVGKSLFWSEGSINPLNLNILVQNFIPKGPQMATQQGPRMAAGGTSNGGAIQGPFPIQNMTFDCKKRNEGLSL